MTTAAQDDAPLSLMLGPLLGSLPDLVFQQEVLKRLGPTYLASLAGAGRGCATAVAATALMRWAKHAKWTSPRYFGNYYLPPLCLKEASSYAVGGGNMEALQWLHNAGCPWTAATCLVVAHAGQLEALQYVRGHGCPWDSRTCSYAALSGHLRVLQWAREHRCSWSSVTPSWAAKGGHLALLQWARGRECPWDCRVCLYAARAGQLEVLQWVRENDATGEAWDVRVRHFAGGPRKREVLTWLDELSGP